MAVTITASGQSAKAEDSCWGVSASRLSTSASASSRTWSARAEGEARSVEVSTSVSMGGEPYGGSYSVTPSDVAQTLRTRGKTLAADVEIAPIPSNYGLITWNGSTLTVS